MCDQWCKSSLSTVNRNVYEGKIQQSLNGAFSNRHIMAPGKGSMMQGQALGFETAIGIANIFDFKNTHITEDETEVQRS